MNIYTTEFKDVIILEPNNFEDERGSFMESFNHEFYNKIIPGWLNNFVQDNESISKKGVFRGFHWQKWPMQQSKLVRVVKGKILDIVICLVKNSPDYGKFIGVELSGENKKQLFIPRGYAHGFISLEDDTIVNYKVDNYWSKQHEMCIHHGCVDFSVFNIDGLKDLELIISEKDNKGVSFGDLKDEDLFFDPDIKTEEKPNDITPISQENEELPESTNITETEE